MEKLVIKGRIKPLIATVTFRPETLLMIKAYRIIDGHHEAFRYSHDDLSIRTLLAEVARRKVDMILENGGKTPQGEMAYEDEGTQYCRCRLNHNLNEVEEWLRRAREGNTLDVWDAGEWSTDMAFDDKSGNLVIRVYGEINPENINRR